jgi:hypothetical protein
MKKRILKRISRHTETLLVAWIKSLLTEEEAAKVSLSNVGSLLPTEYQILTGYYLYQGHKLEEISTDSLLNLKELVEMELTYRKGVFH